jgi:predicted transcriptional regulator
MDAPYPLHLETGELDARAQLARTTVEQIMTRSVICVTPRWTLRELLVVLIEGNMGGVPVVDGSWRPIGVVSKSDIVRHVAEHGSVEGGTVADCMMPLTLSVTPDTKVARAAALMAWEGVHRLPVCAASGDVVGIVTALDITRWVARAL